MNITQFTPLTELKILHDIPISSYEHEIDFFQSRASQAEYFASHAKYSFNEMTPIRVGDNVVRVPVCADDIYNCNYIMFKNRNFNNKWFYAFINKIEFNSINKCNVYFTVDVIQTWLFDYTIPPCFIEREHVNNDIIGAHICPENLELGDYVTNWSKMSGKFNKEFPQMVYVVSTFDKDMNKNKGGTSNGVYSGMVFNCFVIQKQSDYNDVTKFIEKVNNEPNGINGIIAVLQLPSPAFIDDNVNNSIDLVFNRPSSLDGYTPKNNKLLTYPYSFLHVSNLNGSSADYKFERFHDAICHFKIDTVVALNACAFLIPLDYKGVKRNVDEKLTLDGFPQCTYNSDVFTAWWAQNCISYPTSFVGGVMGNLSPLSKPTIGNIMSGVGNTTTLIGEKLQRVHNVQSSPPQSHGQTGGNTMYAADLKDFFFEAKCLQRQQAIIIDDYFTRVGYAVNKIKNVDTKCRKYWNYVKTIGCTVRGSVGVEDKFEIEQAYNNGITFWHTPDVGNYEKDNVIV